MFRSCWYWRAIGKGPKTIRGCFVNQLDQGPKLSTKFQKTRYLASIDQCQKMAGFLNFYDNGEETAPLCLNSDATLTRGSRRNSLCSIAVHTRWQAILSAARDNHITQPHSRGNPLTPKISSLPGNTYLEMKHVCPGLVEKPGGDKLRCALGKAGVIDWQQVFRRA